MAKADNNPFLDMFRDFGKSMQLPETDMNGIMEYHRKNLQALQAATSAGSNSAQALLTKQREALEEMLADLSEMVQAAGKGDADASGMLSSQMDLARKTFETTLQNSREMAEIVQKGNMEALEVLRDRLQESIEEMTRKS